MAEKFTRFVQQRFSRKAYSVIVFKEPEARELELTYNELVADEEDCK